MDKVSNSNPQAMPLWERQRPSRGHKSAVSGALKAHRQRTMERESRVQERLNLVKNMSSQFFPGPQIETRPQLEPSPIQQSPVSNQPLNQASMQNIQQDMVVETPSFTPMEMDEIYKEAQLGSISDNAIALVEKDVANPEDGPVDDMPKGSYIDYTV